MQNTSLKSKVIDLATALLFLVLLYAIQHANASADDGPERTASLHFAISDQHGAPRDDSQSSFDCNDKIFAVTNLGGLHEGKHSIEFRWIEPNGETQERTRYDFFVRNKPSVKLWAWLELSRARGAAMIQWLNPAAGLEEFIGDWKVKILIDGKEVASDGFEVSC